MTIPRPTSPAGLQYNHGHVDSRFLQYYAPGSLTETSTTTSVQVTATFKRGHDLTGLCFPVPSLPICLPSTRKLRDAPSCSEKLDERIARVKVRSYFIGKRFLGETFLLTRICFDLDKRQDRHSCTGLPSPDIPIGLVQVPHSPTLSPMVMDASLTLKKSIDSVLLRVDLEERLIWRRRVRTGPQPRHGHHVYRY